MSQMSQQQQMMMRMRMQHPNMMRAGEPMSNMMSNGGGMEMMGPNGMMMRNSMGPNGPGMNMGGMPRTSGHPGMMQGPGNGMMPGMQGNMMAGGHPGLQHGMGNRPPPPEYGMSGQVRALWCGEAGRSVMMISPAGSEHALHDGADGDGTGARARQ